MSVLEELVRRGRHGPRTAGPDIRSRAALHILDTLGCVVAGASHPLAAQLATFTARTGDTGELCTPAMAGTHSPRTAVLMESVLAHADEYDALHPAAAVIPAAVVVPAALAVADREGLPGSAVTDAVITGYEVVVEAGLRFGGPSLYGRAWWPTAVFGALGSAAAVAHLLRLDEEETIASLGLAAAGLGGLLSADELGAGHYLLAGRAAADGMEAAYLARAGARASRTLLDQPAAAALGAGAAAPSPEGQPHLADCVFKAYPCARPLHAALEALDTLADRGLPLHTARRMEILLPAALLRFVTADRAPAGPTEAAASAAFAVAAWLHGAAGDVAFFRGTLPEDAPEVVLGHAPALDSGLPDHWGARVLVDLADGRRVEQEIVSAGGGAAGATPTEAVTAKFRRQTGADEDDPDWARWIERCLTLDTVPDIGDLRRDLCRLGRKPRRP
ncbi:MmgE/PrpD family protein [Streptomyces sp. NPDC021218]|uniref:MmgE/PrpD family protein n=1 Tax=unclassified Streptomyces TaxID=2593676 RepID=UPI00369034F1